MACDDNDHTVITYEIESGEIVFREKGGPDPIFDLYWSQQDGTQEFVTAGKKHFKWWWPKESKVKKGLYGDKGKATSHASCTFDDNNTAYTGATNSRIYVWADRELQKCYKVHGRGFISACMWNDGKIYSGGRDGQIIISCPDSEQAERTIQVDHLVRAIDSSGGNILAGLINGKIIGIDGSDNTKTVMEGHSMGEAWGLAPISSDEFVTSGDDNQVLFWSIGSKKCTGSTIVCDEDAKPKKGRASTLSELAASKCARAVAYD